MTQKEKIELDKDRLVASILTEFMFTKTMEDVNEVWHRLFKTYNLRYDPFTSTPVSAYDYYANALEYDRQVSENRGLER